MTRLRTLRIWRLCWLREAGARWKWWRCGGHGGDGCNGGDGGDWSGWSCGGGWGCGAAGAAGTKGVTGSTGATGAAGPAGAGLVNYLGAYLSTVNYGNGDVCAVWRVDLHLGDSGESWKYAGLTVVPGDCWRPRCGGAYWCSGRDRGYRTARAGGLWGPGGDGRYRGDGRYGGDWDGWAGYQGAYASTVNYGLGDVVVWDGSSFVSLIAANHGNTPGLVPGTWGALTAQGPAGMTGAIGGCGTDRATGALGPVGPPGEKGDQGAQGIAGQAGAQGLAGATGGTGLQGPMGPTGAAGPVG